MGVLPVVLDIDIFGLSHDVTILIGALTGIVAVLGWAYIHLLKPVKKAVMAMAEIVELQLQPNHGSSLVDRVAQIGPNHQAAETHWKSLELNQEALKKGVNKIVERLNSLEEDRRRDTA